MTRRLHQRVAVIGLGAVGAQALWRLAQRPDLEVVGFERHRPGTPLGASGGDTRMYCSAQYADERYQPLVRRATRSRLELEAASDRSLSRRTGALVLSRRSTASVNPLEITPEDAVERLRAEGVAARLYTGEDLRRLAPEHRIGSEDIGVLDPEAGRLRPELTNIVAVEAARALGAKVQDGTEVSAIEVHARTVHVRTADGTCHVFDQALVASGAWSGELVPHTAGLISTRQLISCWYQAASEPLTGRLQAFIRDAPEHLCGVPSEDGRSIKLGFSRDRLLKVNVDDPRSRSAGADQLSDFDAAARRWLPGVIPWCYRHEVYFEGYTDDSRPLLQRVDDGPLIGTGGFSGHGFKIAPAVGELAADLISGVPTPELDFLHRTELTTHDRHLAETRSGQRALHPQPAEHAVLLGPGDPLLRGDGVSETLTVTDGVPPSRGDASGASGRLLRSHGSPPRPARAGNVSRGRTGRGAGRVRCHRGVREARSGALWNGWLARVRLLRSYSGPRRCAPPESRWSLWSADRTPAPRSATPSPFFASLGHRTLEARPRTAQLLQSDGAWLVSSALQATPIHEVGGRRPPVNHTLTDHLKERTA